MDKAQVKAHIEAIQKKVVDDLEQAYSRDLTSADIDEAETKDPEDFSHQSELNQMARTQKIRLDNSKNELRYLQELPLDEVDSAQEGALVQTEKYFFYVSVATNPFKMDGHTVVGISTEAPIYQPMRDKKAGDSFKFGEHTYNIQSIK